MARLRVYKANGGKVYDLVMYKKEKTEREIRVEIQRQFDSEIKRKRKQYTHDGEFDNLEMHGFLIYLATSDCDGSLGGLISIAQDEYLLQKILDDMIQKALWCSADPLCITQLNKEFHH